MKLSVLLAAAAVAGNAVFGDVTYIRWNTNVHDGNVNEAGNWGNDGSHVPGEGEKQAFESLSGDYTIRVPSGYDYVTKALFDVNYPPNDGVLTFDIAGTWTQDKATYVDPWNSVRFANGGHFFTPEGSYTKGEFAPLKMDNVLLRTWRDAGGCCHLEMSRGLFNTYDVDPSDPHAEMPIMMGGDYGNACIDHIGGTMRIGGINLRGGTFMVNGGTVDAFGSIHIASAYSQRLTHLVVSNGTVNAKSAVYIGQIADPNSAKIIVEGTGRFNNDGNLYVANYSGCGSLEGTEVSFTVRENGVASLHELYVAGMNDNTVGKLFVTDHGYLETSGPFAICNNDHADSYGTVDVSGDAAIKVPQLLIANGKYGNSTMTVGGNSSVTNTGYTYIGRNSSSVESSGTLTVKDNAKYIVSDGAILRVRTGGAFYLEDNAELISTNATVEITDSNSGLIEFRGGRSTLGEVKIYGLSDGTMTNTFRVAGGDHRAVKDNRGNVLGMVIGANRTLSCFEMTGGKMAVPRLVLCGNFASSVESGIFRMLGGEFEIYPINNSTECDLNVADATGSRGCVELLGGTLKVRKLLGWTGASWRGGNGYTRLYADGGTLAPQHDIAANNYTFNEFVTGFDEAKLGSKGLTLDGTTYAVSCNQSFSDVAAGVTGRVIKVGNMPFTVYANSSHGETVLCGGTMKFDNAAVTQFGRIVTVTNNATVSLVGAPASLIAERITLGDTTTKGMLEIDLGDMITLTGNNALVAPNGYIRVLGNISSIGEWEIFTLDNGATVSDAELAKIRIRGGDSAFYSYTLSQANGKIKLVSAQRTFNAVSWTGAESSSWNSDGNWTSAVPDEDSEATFPPAALNRQIVLASGSKAAKLHVNGTYGFSGGNLATEYIDVSNGGQLTLSSTLTEPDRDVVVEKTGSGELVLGTSSPSLTKDWSFGGGRTIVAVADALGGENDGAVVAVGPATLSFNCTGSITRNLELNAGDARAALLNSTGDMTVSGTVNAVDGGLAKTGAGKLTLDLPEGTHVLARGHMGSQSTPVNELVLPENGDAPSAQSANPALAGLTAIDGHLRILGKGKDVTRIETRQYVMVGAGCVADGNPVLEVSGCYWQANDAGYHTHVGGPLTSGSKGLRPTLLLNEGTVLNGDCLYIGCNPTWCGDVGYAPTLAMTNAQAYSSWEVNFGAGANATATARLGGGSLVESGGGGFNIDNGKKDIVVDEGSIFRSPVSKSANGIRIKGGAYGRLELLNGGTLEAARIGSQWGNAQNEDFIIGSDGGRFVFTGGSNTSILYYAEHQWIETKGAGTTFDIAEGGIHDLFIKVTGEGSVTKTGAGTLVFREKSSGEVGYSINPSSDKATVAFTGPLVVAQGEVRFESADTINGTVKIGGTGIADFSGATLNEIGIDVDAVRDGGEVPTLKNLTSPTAKVYFNGSRITYNKNDRLPVAKLGTGVTVAAFKAKDVGGELTARFDIEDGTVYAKILCNSGTMLIMR